MGWVDYLGIGKSKYYEDPNECSKVIMGLIIMNLRAIRGHMNDLEYLYKYSRNMNKKIPPFPCDFYKNVGIVDLSQLINIK